MCAAVKALRIVLNLPFAPRRDTKPYMDEKYLTSPFVRQRIHSIGR